MQKNIITIIVHSRSPSNDTYTILKENMTKVSCIIIHNLKWHMNIKIRVLFRYRWSTTFKNSKEIKEVVEMIDLKHLVRN